MYIWQAHSHMTLEFVSLDEKMERLISDSLMQFISSICLARKSITTKTRYPHRDLFFKKMGQSRPLFVNFCSFLITISMIQIAKSLDVCLGFEPAAAGWY